MQFVVMGSVNAVSTKIIVVKIVTVFRIIVLVKLISQNARNKHNTALFVEKKRNDIEEWNENVHVCIKLS